MFLGVSFAGTDSSVSNSAVSDASISTFTLSNMIIDELYATQKVLTKFEWNIPSSWGLDTYLHATFENNLHAGNLSYSTDIVSKIKVKKRFVGDFEWKTIHEQEVNTNEDFAVEYYDYYEPTGREIEYAYVLVVGGSDVESAIATVTSEFDTYFICGQNGESYPMILNMSNEYSYKRQSQLIAAPGREYPYVNHNGKSKYYSGTLTVSFIEMENNCLFDVENAWKYRNEIDKFLTDGRPKIVKSFEGDMWMVSIVGDINRQSTGHYQLVNQQFEWAEAGNPYLVGDLFDNGFINTDVDRE